MLASTVNAAASNVAQSAVGSQAEATTLHLLCQLIVILVVTRMTVWIGARFLGQTAVAGEILAGLVLGPSVLGAIFPNVLHALFGAETSGIFLGISQVGLVLLMFQIGLEFEFKKCLSGSARAIFAISVASMALPFFLGFAAAPLFFNPAGGADSGLLAFRLFFAVSMSITAIPILGRIFIELKLSHTRTAALTIGSAAINDMSGWLILGVIGAIVTAKFEIESFSLRLAGLVAYLGIVMYVWRPMALRRLAARMKSHRGLDNGAIALILLSLFVSGVITSELGVFTIIGGFVLGVALHEDRSFVEQWNQKIGGLVGALFLPVFFVYTGLRTDVGSLATPTAWMQCAAVCAIAFSGKFGGAYVAARMVGEPSRSAFTIGVCMNTRALMELIVINIGYDLGVLPRQMFTILVIMAVASTFVATPLIRALMRSESDLPANAVPGAA